MDRIGKTRHKEFCRQCAHTAAGEFQKMADLKELGVEVYRYIPTTTEETISNIDLDEKIVKTLRPRANNLFLVINNNERLVTSDEILPEYDISKIPCLRCRFKLQELRNLLKSDISSGEIQQKALLAICDHCRCLMKQRETCIPCKKTIKKFLSIKAKDKVKLVTEEKLTERLLSFKYKHTEKPVLAQLPRIAWTPNAKILSDEVTHSVSQRKDVVEFHSEDNLITSFTTNISAPLDEKNTPMVSEYYPTLETKDELIYGDIEKIRRKTDSSDLRASARRLKYYDKDEKSHEYNVNNDGKTQARKPQHDFDKDHESYESDDEKHRKGKPFEIKIQSLEEISKTYTGTESGIWMSDKEKSYKKAQKQTLEKKDRERTKAEKKILKAKLKKLPHVGEETIGKPLKGKSMIQHGNEKEPADKLKKWWKRTSALSLKDEKRKHEPEEKDSKMSLTKERPSVGPPSTAEEMKPEPESDGTDIEKRGVLLPEVVRERQTSKKKPSPPELPSVPEEEKGEGEEFEVEKSKPKKSLQTEPPLVSEKEKGDAEEFEVEKSKTRKSLQTEPQSVPEKEKGEGDEFEVEKSKTRKSLQTEPPLVSEKEKGEGEEFEVEKSKPKQSLQAEPPSDPEKEKGEGEEFEVEKSKPKQSLQTEPQSVPEKEKGEGEEFEVEKSKPKQSLQTELQSVPEKEKGDGEEFEVEKSKPKKSLQAEPPSVPKKEKGEGEEFKVKKSLQTEPPLVPEKEKGEGEEFEVKKSKLKRSLQTEPPSVPEKEKGKRKEVGAKKSLPKKLLKTAPPPAPETEHKPPPAAPPSVPEKEKGGREEVDAKKLLANKPPPDRPPPVPEKEKGGREEVDAKKLLASKTPLSGPVPVQEKEKGGKEEVDAKKLLAIKTPPSGPPPVPEKEKGGREEVETKKLLANKPPPGRPPPVPEKEKGGREEVEAKKLLTNKTPPSGPAPVPEKEKGGREEVEAKKLLANKTPPSGPASVPEKEKGAREEVETKKLLANKPPPGRPPPVPEKEKGGREEVEEKKILTNKTPPSGPAPVPEKEKGGREEVEAKKLLANKTPPSGPALAPEKEKGGRQVVETKKLLANKPPPGRPPPVPEMERGGLEEVEAKKLLINKTPTAPVPEKEKGGREEVETKKLLANKTPPSGPASVPEKEKGGREEMAAKKLLANKPPPDRPPPILEKEKGGREEVEAKKLLAKKLPPDRPPPVPEKEKGGREEVEAKKLSATKTPPSGPASVPEKEKGGREEVEAKKLLVNKTTPSGPASVPEKEEVETRKLLANKPPPDRPPPVLEKEKGGREEVEAKKLLANKTPPSGPASVPEKEKGGREEVEAKKLLANKIPPPGPASVPEKEEVETRKLLANKPPPDRPPPVPEKEKGGREEMEAKKLLAIKTPPSGPASVPEKEKGGREEVEAKKLLANKTPPSGPASVPEKEKGGREEVEAKKLLANKTPPSGPPPAREKEKEQKQMAVTEKFKQEERDELNTKNKQDKSKTGKEVKVNVKSEQQKTKNGHEKEKRSSNKQAAEEKKKPLPVPEPEPEHEILKHLPPDKSVDREQQTVLKAQKDLDFAIKNVVHSLNKQKDENEYKTKQELLKAREAFVLPTIQRSLYLEEKCSSVEASSIFSDLEKFVVKKKLVKRKYIGDVVRGKKIEKRLRVKSNKPKETQQLLFKSAYDAFSQPQLVNLPATSSNSSQPPITGVMRFALSDHTCIDKGWTMLPTETIVRKMNIYRVRPANPEQDWFKRNKSKGYMLYDTGEKLAQIDQTGHGRWYYKNGQLALEYYESKELNNQHRVLVYSSGEPDERGKRHPVSLLAMFDHLGSGVIFDHAGKIRIKYNQSEGVVLDQEIGPFSHWKWHGLNDPPELQNVMIDTKSIDPDPTIMSLENDDVKKTRLEDVDMLAIELDNFVKERSKKQSSKFEPFHIKMKVLKINDQFSLRIVDQSHVYLHFKHGSANIKLNLGMILDSQEIVGTQTVDVAAVMNSLEERPPRTDSLLQMQKNLANIRRNERIHTELAQRISPKLPVSSADRLLKSASKPPHPTVLPRRASSTCNTSCAPPRKPTQTNLYYCTRIA